MYEQKDISNKLNIINNDLTNVKKEAELTKKAGSKTIQNLLENQPVKNIDIINYDSRHSTVPNKNNIKQKKNYEHLKITAKNKENENKEISPMNIINNGKCNYVGILLQKKMLGNSLPKNYKNINNNVKIESPNYNSNVIKRIISSKNMVVENDNYGTEIYHKIQNSNIKNISNGFNNNKNNYSIKSDNIKYFKELKINNQNNQRNNQKEIFNDIPNPNNLNIKTNNIYLGINIIHQPMAYNNNINNNRIRPNNSFNNSTNIIIQNNINNYNYNYNNEGKTGIFKGKTLKPKNIQNIMINNMNIYKSKRSMSSSIKITRNKSKEMNGQDFLDGFVIYPDEIMRNTNNGVFGTILEYNENEKYNMYKMIKNNSELEKNFQKKKNIYQYLILPGNASYLVKNCMHHRINWISIENPPENCNTFNFKWKELSHGIDYNSLNRTAGLKQIVNHYENHYVLSNKANMFINLMKYCEQRKLSVFKYVPFTIVFKLKEKKKIKDVEKQKRWTEKLEKLKNFIQNIDKNLKNYNEIGKFYDDIEYIKDKEKRNEFERNLLIKKQKEKELEESKEKEREREKNKKDKNKEKEKEKEKDKDKEKEEKDKIEEEKFIGKFEVYSDIFPRLKITDRLPTRYKSSEEKEKDKKNDKIIIGNNTLIEVPKTHFKGKNMWVLKAVNLNRGMCIKVVNSFEQMEKVINKFKEGVDHNFTLEEIEEEQNQQQVLSEDETSTKSLSKKPNSIQLDENEEKSSKNDKIKSEENIIKNNSNSNNENKGDNKIGKEEDKDEKIFNFSKIVIQKYIESPLLYKGRKCDIRIWVLLTHQMKVFLFKEGHLKTCSVEYNLNNKDAFTHITNYSFQKYNSNFQKFEKGNEVPFYEFQKFIDKEYPEKNYKIKKDLMKGIKEIITISMRCAKDKINKNGRSYQFEIYGYDFMVDSDFNVFLIEINTNPGIEISSPWIQIIIPRMLDDALRLTVDKVFDPIYDFNKNYNGDYTEEQKKLLINSKIEVDFNAVTPIINKDSSSVLSSSISNNNISSPHIPLPSNSNNIFKINLDLDEVDKKLIKGETVNNKENKEVKEIKENKDNKENKENKEKNKEIKVINKNKQIKEVKDINKNKIINNNNKEEKENKDNKINKNFIKDNKANKGKDKREGIRQIQIDKNKYISPFPVPGYSLDENLWDFVCDLNAKDPLEVKIEKEVIEKDSFTGIRHLLKKKDKKNNIGKKGKKINKKNKNKKEGK